VRGYNQYSDEHSDANGDKYTDGYRDDHVYFNVDPDAGKHAGLHAAMDCGDSVPDHDLSLRFRKSWREHVCDLGGIKWFCIERGS